MTRDKSRGLYGAFVKGVSYRLIHKKGDPSIRKALWTEHLWSPSYFAEACGGAPLLAI